MNSRREPGVSPEAQNLLSGLRVFLRDSAELTSKQLFYLDAIKRATLCNPDVFAALDDEVTRHIEENTALASSAAMSLTSQHGVVVTVSHEGYARPLGGIGYSTQKVSYIALIGSGPQGNSGAMEKILDPNDLGCMPIQRPNGTH